MATALSEKNVLVLQGGGALGSYQAGAVATLMGAGHAPDWVAGISIGAINAAIICGNPPEKRVDRLRELWSRMTSGLQVSPLSDDVVVRRAFNEFSAATTATFGVPGFFSPRPSLPLLWPANETSVSIYGTKPLRETLLELVDFDRLNSGETRISIGAVNVRTGNFRYFDSQNERITPEHIMASGALPPGFPPVEIDGELYWDGGLVSNTPLQYVLEMCGPRDHMCIFQIDLFSARGPAPTTLIDVSQREKDIRFSSRTRLNTDVFRDLQTIRRHIRRLSERLPEALRDDPDWRALSDFGCGAAITIVQLIHRAAAYETNSKDYEFSRYTMMENWSAGVRDVETTLAHPAWRDRTPPDYGVAILDLTKEQDS
ncbi:patatin-like phospholipase family protein [Methylocystis sp. JR02]|uniref:patatin-like phospholipase family protein n=1 Tax=Methylocystis sp. JR02 TaxID=3046284 RepID=UPI0024BA1386|nr:patatin-like phospholipase family protein [Methylocystis sp. JR02]MDJ0449604.1 patatin-like phospholipase family protein [Methylocystis sp. JR02]